MKPSIALVYDRVNTPYGGAEKVLSALHLAYPDAPLFTSVYHPRARWASSYEIHPSFLQHFPFAKKHHRLYAPLMPLAFESHDLSQFDIVISITSAEAKGVITRPDQLHICYLLTPTRYLYSHRLQYQQTHWPFKVPILSWLSNKMLDYLTWWDQAAAFRPDVIIPISNLVAERTEKYYHRPTSKVIYPPIAVTDQSSLTSTTQYAPYYLPDKYLLIVSRLVPYKQLDIAIQAAQRMGRNLVVVGEGPAAAQLQKLASETTYFLGSVTQAQLHAIMDQATALLMPGLEDFGITAIEAAYQELPVILHSKSGAAEILGENAITLQNVNLNTLTKAISKLDTHEVKSAAVKKKIEKYAINEFTKRFTDTVTKMWNQKGRHERS